MNYMITPVVTTESTGCSVKASVKISSAPVVPRVGEYVIMQDGEGNLVKGFASYISHSIQNNVHEIIIYFEPSND